MFSQNIIAKAVRYILNDRIYHFKVLAADAVAASTTGVHAGITDAGDGTATTVTTGITNPAVPRNITATSDDVAGDGLDIKAVQVIITGTNYYDAIITETLPIFTVNAETTVAGSKAFKTVTSILSPAHDSPYDVIIRIGWGDILGLHHTKECIGVCDAFLNKVHESTAAVTVGDVDEIEKNTIDLNSALNATQVDAYVIVG